MSSQIPASSMVSRLATELVNSSQDGSFALMQTLAASQQSVQAVLVRACNSYKQTLAQVRSRMDALLVENGSLKEKLITFESQHEQYKSATTAAMKALEEENAKREALLQEKEVELIQLRGENGQLKESLSKTKEELQTLRAKASALADFYRQTGNLYLSLRAAPDIMALLK